MPNEASYYPFVEDFIRKEFDCIATSRNKGYISLGLVDVIGVYDISTEYNSDVEIVFVEVKTDTTSYGKSLGQALGYSIYGERCYLAIPFEGEDTFLKNQIYMADHLGVGLIRIQLDENRSPRSMSIILTSRKHIPIESQKKYMLRAIGVSMCSFCGIYLSTALLHSLARTSSNSLFGNKTRRRMNLCGQCFETLIPDKLKVELENRSNVARRAVATRKLSNKSIVILKDNEES